MHKPKTIRELGFGIGELQPGPLNRISDVAGVLVGHSTIHRDDVHTGVTAIVPHGGNLFREKVPAAAHVINGFGKSLGLMQIHELGTLESPIVLTNTLSIGTAADALIDYMLAGNPDIGVTTGSVNPVVGECNDGYLSDIRGRHVQKAHVLEALESASECFEQGAVGAGAGMCAYELKGGIGSSSRVVGIDGTTYTVGMLVLANMGKLKDLLVFGDPVGRRLAARLKPAKDHMPAGSIIMVLATDLPLCERQLGRLARRALVGLSRTGSAIDSGSGEVVLAFSTANRIAHYPQGAVTQLARLNEERLDAVFRAVAHCAEEAVLNAMLTAAPVNGIRGHVAHSLADHLDALPRPNRE